MVEGTRRVERERWKRTSELTGVSKKAEIRAVSCPRLLKDSSRVSRELDPYAPSSSLLDHQMFQANCQMVHNLLSRPWKILESKTICQYNRTYFPTENPGFGRV